MLRWILGTFVLSEAAIGIVLTGLLLAGRADQRSIVDAVSFIGFVVFACGLLPLLSKIRKSVSLEPKAEPEGDEDTESDKKSTARDFMIKHEKLFRAILIGGIVFGHGLGLFYLTGSF